MFAVFGTALKDIAARPAAAATLILLPLLANVLAELNLTRALIASDYYGGTGASLLAFWVNMAAVAFIAVGWHRLVLLEEDPTLVPPARGALYFRYFIAWMVIGFIIMAGFALFGGALYLIAVWLGADMSMSNPLLFLTMEGISTMMGGFAAMVILIFLFLWFSFRCGILLPHLALYRKHMTIREAWGLTRPHVWAVTGAAACAGVLQALAFSVPVVFYEYTFDLETGEAIVWAEYLFSAINVIVYTVSALIGAAILTVIYKRVDLPTLP